MPEYLVRRVSPDGTPTDQLYRSESEARFDYDAFVATPAPNTVARVLLYQRGISDPIASTDMHAEPGPLMSAGTSGPEPINSEGHTVRPAVAVDPVVPQGVVVEATPQVEPTATPTVPQTGRQQGATVANDSNVADAVPSATGFPDSTTVTERNPAALDEAAWQNATPVDSATRESVSETPTDIP